MSSLKTKPQGRCTTSHGSGARIDPGADHRNQTYISFLLLMILMTHHFTFLTAKSPDHINPRTTRWRLGKPSNHSASAWGPRATGRCLPPKTPAPGWTVWSAVGEAVGVFGVWRPSSTSEHPQPWTACDHRHGSGCHSGKAIDWCCQRDQRCNLDGSGEGVNWRGGLHRLLRVCTK